MRLQDAGTAFAASLDQARACTVTQEELRSRLCELEFTYAFGSVKQQGMGEFPRDLQKAVPLIFLPNEYH
jgi:hypothetical protein